MNAHSIGRLQEVYSGLRNAVFQMNRMFEAEFQSDTLEVVQGLRSWNEQAKLYAQGRTAPGPIATYAPPGYSWHSLGCAVDLCPASLLAKPGWEPGSPLWPRMVAMAQACGLYPGACFHTHPDVPHFQMTGKYPASPTDEVRQIFTSGGTVQAVWDEAFK